MCALKRGVAEVHKVRISCCSTSAAIDVTHPVQRLL